MKKIILIGLLLGSFSVAKAGPAGPGPGAFIQNSRTLQPGATFAVSSGTALNVYVSTLTFLKDGSTLVVAPVGGGGTSSLQIKLGGTQISSPTAAIVLSSSVFTASQSPTGTANVGLSSASVTLQGNTFNGANQLIQANGAGALPVISGANLTGLTAANLSGQVPAANLSNAVLNQNALQSGAALHVASGTVDGTLIAGTFSGGGSGLTAVPATSLSGTVPNASLDSSSVTKQGNTFNAASKLVQLSGSGLIPNSLIDGSSITKQGVLNEIHNQSTLQSGAQFNVSSATVVGNFTAGTLYGNGSNLTGIVASLTAGSTLYIQNTSTLQSGATCYVASATVAGKLTVGGTIAAGPSGVVITTSGGNLDATKLSGAVPDASLSGSYNSAVSFNNAGNNYTGTYYGSGANLTGIPTSAISFASNSYVMNQATIQNGATLYVSSGTASFLNSSKGQFYSIGDSSVPLTVIGSNASGQTGHLQDWKLDANTSGPYVTGAGVFTGSGAGLTNLTAANLTGTIAAVSLSTAILNQSSLQSGAQFNVATGTVANTMTAGTVSTSSATINGPLYIPQNTSQLLQYMDGSLLSGATFWTFLKSTGTLVYQRELDSNNLFSGAIDMKFPYSGNNYGDDALNLDYMDYTGEGPNINWRQCIFGICGAAKQLHFSPNGSVAGSSLFVKDGAGNSLAEFAGGRTVFSSGLAVNISSYNITSNQTISPAGTELTNLYDATSGSITVVMPQLSLLATPHHYGRIFTFKKVDTSTSPVVIFYDPGNSGGHAGAEIGRLTIPGQSLTVQGDNAGNTNYGWEAIGSHVPIFGPTTPANFSTDRNDWDPGWYDVFRASPTSNVNVTGLAKGVDGRKVRVFDVGGSTMTFKSESASSASYNRIRCQNLSDVVVGPDGSIDLYYDGTSQRWRCE